MDASRARLPVRVRERFRAALAISAGHTAGPVHVRLSQPSAFTLIITLTATLTIILPLPLQGTLADVEAHPFLCEMAAKDTPSEDITAPSMLNVLLPAIIGGSTPIAVGGTDKGPDTSDTVRN